MLNESDVPHRKESIVNGRPKLLFLACYFPPVQASGSVRTWNMSKYLARCGWDVTVVTPHPSVWRNVHDPESVSKKLNQDGIRRILTGHRWRCLSPDDLRTWNRGLGWLIGGLCRRQARLRGIDKGIGWIKEADRACSHLTANDVDVILATGTPFASFQLAKRLSERLGRPYVLDYRDPWLSDNDGRHPARVIRTTEEALIRSCSAVTAVSKSLLNGHLDVAPKLHVIPNGFDPEEMEQVKRFEFGHFAIVYTGIFYPPKRVITPVIKALRRLKETGVTRGVEWRFHYYGPDGDHVREEAERFGVTDRVVVHGSVTRAEALSAVRGAAVTVVITSVLEEVAAKDKGVVTGKLFEPLGLRVPVLLIGPSGADVEAIVEKTGLVRIVTAKDIDGMTSFLGEVMSGRVPKAKSPDTYAWPNIVTKLDALLREVVADNRDPAHVRDGGAGRSEWLERTARQAR